MNKDKDKRYIVFFAIKLFMLIIIANIGELANMKALLDVAQIGAGVYIALGSYLLLDIMYKQRKQRQQHLHL